MHPLQIETARIAADGSAVFVQVSPHHEFPDILDLDVIRFQGIDVAE